MREPDALDAARVLAVGLLLLALVPLAAQGPAAHLLVQAIFAATPLVYARVAGLRPLASAGFARLSWGQGGLILVASMGSMWLLKGLDDLVSLGLDLSGEREDIRRGVEAAGRWGFGGALAAIALLPALCEETFFRGLVLRGFAARFGTRPALLFTTLGFAAAHAGVGQRIMMVFVGLYFGALVRLTGSLWAAVLAHAVNNAAVILLYARYGARVDGMHPSAGMLALSGLVFSLSLTLLFLYRPGRNPVIA